MVDVTIVGGGTRARDCAQVLSRAGFELAHSFTIDTGDRSPIILGDLHGGYQVAMEAVQTGRHILIAGSQVLTPERLALMLEHRRQAQALFVWSERRFHPGYSLLAGLIETDAAWRPRYLRHETLSQEPTTSSALRWLTLESLALVQTLIDEEPVSVGASTVLNPKRNAPDLVNATIRHREVEVNVLVGMGEPMARRETLVAGDTRKAFVDELNRQTPIRIMDDQPVSAMPPRWLSTPSPSDAELARLQSIAFLQSTLHAEETREEAALWLRSLSALDAMEQSIATRATADVVVKQEDHRFRIVQGLRTTPPSVA